MLSVFWVIQSNTINSVLYPLWSKIMCSYNQLSRTSLDVWRNLILNGGYGDLHVGKYPPSTVDYFTMHYSLVGKHPSPNQCITLDWERILSVHEVSGASPIGCFSVTPPYISLLLLVTASYRRLLCTIHIPRWSLKDHCAFIVYNCNTAMIYWSITCSKLLCYMK